MPRPMLSKTTTNVVKPKEASMLQVVHENQVALGAVLTVDPDPTLQVHERVVDIRYGAKGSIFGFYKDERPGEDKLLQDLVAISLDELIMTDWGLMGLAFVPRNMIVRESEWLKGGGHE